jgi:hypothetical protein
MMKRNRYIGMDEEELMKRKRKEQRRWDEEG